MTTVYRIDRRVVALDFDDPDTAPDPTSPRAPAMRTPEGYLEVDALLARDGCLEYSDGASTWLEYRSRDELVACAASFAHAPVTDDHPPVMVSAENWTEYARGLHVSTPTVTEPDADGTSHLRARIRVTDADLVARIADGTVRELSIGFTSDVLVGPGVAPDGTKYDAQQTAMRGNHTAVVLKGRAGTARVLMDGQAVPTSDPTMDQNPKQDDLGAPVDQVEVTGPAGEKATVPTWIAALLEQAMAALAAPPAAAPEAPAAASPAPELPAAPADAAPPVPPPAAPAAPEAKPEEEEKKDDVRTLARRRAKLERLALEAGLDEARIDASDDTELSRLFVAARIPQARVDSYDAHQLAAIVDVAAQLPAAPTNPFELPRRVEPKHDSADAIAAAYLKSQGF